MLKNYINHSTKSTRKTAKVLVYPLPVLSEEAWSTAKTITKKRADRFKARGETEYTDKCSASKVFRWLEKRYDIVSDTKEVEKIKKLKRVAGALTVRGPTSADRIDEISAKLFEEMPWQRHAIEQLWKSTKERIDADTPMPPVLLHGPPGWGKSTLARMWSELCNRPHILIDAGSAAAAMRIAGTEKGWSSASPGSVVEMIIAHRCADPLIIVDEIDKIGGTVASHVPGLSDALLPFLDQGTAAKWQCPYFRVTFDMRNVSWVLTANNLHRVSEPLRDRCLIIKCPKPTQKDIARAASILAERAGLDDYEEIGHVLARNRVMTSSLRAIARVVARIKSEAARDLLN